MQAVATGFTLIEGPVWDPGKGLYFSDVLEGGINLLDRQGKVSVVVPKRRGVGGMALHAEHGLVVGGRDIAYVDLDKPTAEPKTLLAIAAIPGATGFNDLTTDHSGRIYVGSLAFRVFGGDQPKPGKLNVIDLDGSVRSLSDGVMLTNGMGVSPDNDKLYHSDARSEHIRVYDVKPDGSVGPFRVFATLGTGGVPDGLKVASDGSVWAADAHGGRVVVFNPDGTHRMDVKVPLPMVTSLCFGGDDLRDLYVVTGSVGGPNDHCGTVFRTRVDVPGLALARAKVRVPA
jgi:gluconolactonase